MGDKYLIGVDSGSQSTKVVIFNQRGDIICSASEKLKEMMSTKPGYVEHPDDDLWDSLKIASQKVMKEFKGDPKDIMGLGLCSIRCCRVFMKKDGTLAQPVMSWMDIRSYEKFQDDNPEISYTCPTSGYLTHRLTGEFKDTAANAFQWQFPVDMDTWDWSADEEYFNSFNIPKEKLLDLRMPGTVLGYVTEEAAGETGLPSGIPVVATANDKAVEALGSGLLKTDAGFISLGTYIASMVCGSKNEASPANFWTNLSCIPNRYLYESNGIRRGMWHISWYKSIIGEEYAAKAKSEGYSVEEYLAKEAVNAPAGSDGLLTIPDWLAPASQLHRKGVMIGFDERHTRGHIYRSILEGIALTLKNHYDAMINEIGIKPDKIIISGGGSNSDLFMQIFADAYGVKTVRNEMNGAAALGAAICVAVAAGLYGGFDEAVQQMVKQKDEFIPNEENHEVYSRINTGVYRELPNLMEETLKTIYKATMKQDEQSHSQ
ncbi:sugar (pentulose or hexulose) kinase [Anaerobacterium chartisolvens]|uniref:Sugar (Pentulose or hexulose) kinase n=1 Tax=Anaerobacterium chartisolvens TaxID=1297424 RepID=A0A369B935_9FIRM|nr:FGGY-family carbohydrate kinase [Anaerobacterium chartisolvens]RCX17921.1 sugar (pentulose or hexulose) kinase [Anaerobacterium chartisolvens]